jgi:predicted Ser/Thr protein kinase
VAAASLKSGRYEIKGILGHGGMGVVYRCYDALISRDVALKTLRGAPDQAALAMFHRECKVLAALSHPNIVEIFDVGELEEEGVPRPYFVMPLLPGAPLDQVLRDPRGRPGVRRVVDILCQVCRGLEAAHERGLVHRDIKPSNIFVMGDDSVKIIDFGVAHMVGAGASTTAKGTLFHMAPEQIRLRAPSALSDVFSVGVVAWECLTGRRPFEGVTEEEVARAILECVPPPASDLNPEVNLLVGRVIHKSMAKEPRHRFGSAREFGEALQSAARGEPLQLFDAARIRPRVERAARAFEQGDHQFAAEILGEIEAEGYLDTSIAALRREIARAAREQAVAGLLECARRRFANGECGLALGKVRAALQLDPENPEAVALRRRIEEPRVAGSARGVPGWALLLVAAGAALAVLGAVRLRWGSCGKALPPRCGRRVSRRNHPFPFDGRGARFGLLSRGLRRRRLPFRVRCPAPRCSWTGRRWDWWRRMEASRSAASPRATMLSSCARRTTGRGCCCGASTRVRGCGSARARSAWPLSSECLPGSAGSALR